MRKLKCNCYQIFKNVIATRLKINMCTIIKMLLLDNYFTNTEQEFQIPTQFMYLVLPKLACLSSNGLHTYLCGTEPFMYMTVFEMEGSSHSSAVL